MEKLKNYDIFDLCKIFLSIMIVAIHTNILPEILYPWLRIAVPLFFVISSFFLFSKINNSPKEEKWGIIKKYAIRLAKLYLFWFIVLLPITIFERKVWFNNGMLKGTQKTISSLLFSSTFIASWYITATIEGTAIVAKLSEKINNKVLDVIFLVIYIICCLISSYSTFFENNSVIKQVYNYYQMIFTSPVFSFPVSLLWIYIGKLFADNKSKLTNLNKNVYVLTSLISIVLLYIEWRYVVSINHIYSNDCYLCLVPLVFSIFAIIKNIEIHLKNSKKLRSISNIIYPLHASLVVIIKKLVTLIITNQVHIGIITFFITLFCCIIISLIILKLENKKGLKILKYAH